MTAVMAHGPRRAWLGSRRLPSDAAVTAAAVVRFSCVSFRIFDGVIACETSTWNDDTCVKVTPPTPKSTFGIFVSRVFIVRSDNILQKKKKKKEATHNPR